MTIVHFMNGSTIIEDENSEIWINITDYGVRIRNTEASTTTYYPWHMIRKVEELDDE